MIRTALARDGAALWAHLAVEASESGITRIHLGPGPLQNAGEPRSRSSLDSPAAGPAAEALRQLHDFLEGRRTTFDVPLDLSGTTPFRRSVFEALLAIPFGETVSYGDVARSVGCRSARAVGQAVGSNPLPIVVPCHRVVAGDGRLGGFSCGLDYKVALLALEGIRADAASFGSRIARTD